MPVTGKYDKKCHLNPGVELFLEVNEYAFLVVCPPEQVVQGVLEVVQVGELLTQKFSDNLLRTCLISAGDFC
jgi:hypothetical protein